MAEIALVAGGNRGIAREVCRQLSPLGFIVYLGTRTLEHSRLAVRQIGLPNVRAIELDRTDERSVMRARRTLERDHGRLDLLINNGTTPCDVWQNVVDADLNVVRDAFEADTLGPWRLSQALVPLLECSGNARIVNVTSEYGHVQYLYPGAPAHSVSKAALNAVTIMLAKQLTRRRIAVNAVDPGYTVPEGETGRPITDAAAGIVWAATLPDGGPSGGFFRDCKRISW